MWTKWCLRGRDPWVYAIFYLLEGRKTWSRPVLLVYWALIGIISVAAWNRQLARSRKYRPRAIGNPETAPQLAVPSTPTEARQPAPSDPIAPPTPAIPSMISFSNLPNGVQMSLAATEFLDAADKRVPTLTLNARRKSFHGIAVLMFLPGIAFDVSVGPSVGDPRVDSLFILSIPSRMPTPKHKAGIYSFGIQRCICAIHFYGVCAILCTVPVWSISTRLHERVRG